MRRQSYIKTSALMCAAFLATLPAFGQSAYTFRHQAKEKHGVSLSGGRAKFSGLRVHGDPGKPALPGYTLTFLLPPDTDLNQLTFSLEGGRIQTLPNTYAVDPAPAVAINGKEVWPAGASIVNGKDMAVYGQNTFFPANWVSQPQVGQSGRYLLAEVHVNPYRYNPVTQKLQVMTGGQIVAHAPSRSGRSTAIAAAPMPSSVDTALQQKVQSIAVNYEEGIKSYSQTPMPLAATSSASTYLIVSTDAIRTGSSKLGAFADSKATKCTVEMVTESALWKRQNGAWGNVGSGWGGGLGDGAAEHLRAWMKSNWASQAVQDVLLIGNPDPNSGDVPMKMCWPRKNYPDWREAPSDFYYAELSGNWDLNGDGIYGDYDSDFAVGGADKYAEVNIGRIPYYGKMADLDHILDKSTRYENATNIAWRSSALLPMEPSDASTPGYHLGEQIRTDFLLPKAFSSVRVYEENYGVNPEVTPCSYSTVLNAWQNGAFGLVSWWTHGWDRGAADIMTTENAALLNNQYPSFTFQCSCLNATPETTDNLGYALLLNGSIGTVSATRVSWYYGGQTVFSGTTNTNSSMTYQFSGDMVRDSKKAGQALSDLRSRMEIDGCWWWMNALVFNLYGDPSLSLASHGEQGIAVTVNPSSATVPAGATYSFQASVTDTSDTAVTWSVVESGGGTVDANGLYSAPTAPGTYHVRATSHADATKSADATVTVQSVGDFSENLTYTNPNLTITFTPNVPVSWVDIHYKTSRNGIQQNLRMTQNGNTWTMTSVPQPTLQDGDTVTYFFTYMKSTGAVDSAWITKTIGQVTPPPPTPFVLDNFNSALRWAQGLNSLGKAVSTSGGLYNLEGDADLYFFYNGGAVSQSFTEHIDQSLDGLQNLLITAKGNQGGEENDLTLVLSDGTDHALPLSRFGALGTSYQTVTIPLASFGVDLGRVTTLRIEGRGLAKTVRFDEIQFQ